MDRDVLTKKLKEKIEKRSKHYSKEDFEKHYENFIKFHNSHREYEDIMICIEEMAELTQNLSKVYRGKMDINDVSVLEEIADVELCINELIQSYNLDKEKIEYIKDIKHERLIERYGE